MASVELALPQEASTGFSMRDYQREAVEKAVAYLKQPRHRNGLLVLPTGSGKSIVIANIVRELDAPTLVFQPSKEILIQNHAKLCSYGYKAGIYSASAGTKKLGDITFATVGSVVKKPHLLERFQYILVDECHSVNAKGGMYEEVISTMGVRVLGLTATPYRLGRETDEKGMTRSVLKFLTRTRPRVFEDVVYYVQNRDLFDRGYLAKLVYHSVKVINRAALQRNSTGADYTDESVREQYRISGFDRKLVQVVNRLFEIGRRNVLVFTRFVEESRSVAAQVPGAAVVTAETPTAERDRIIAGFRAGRIRCVCNVGILTTGFDYPELEAVVMARPTMSLALWYQVVGRGIRPHPQKDHTMVIDMGGNLEQFGRVEDLELSDEGGWHVRSNGRQLTNVPFGASIQIRR
jgi:DNA repair protein RadD